MTIVPILRRVRHVGLGLAAAALLLGSAGAQERRSDEEYVRLIERLEQGMSALRELGRGDALELLERVTNRVREERAAARRGGRDPARRESDEIRTVRERLKVMRHAVEVFVESGRHEMAHAVELAMRARELAIEGRGDAEAREIRAGAPDRGQLAELLAEASRLHRELGHPDRADMLRELSQVFGQQWRRQREAEREGRTEERAPERREGPPARGLDSLERRVHVLRIARDAFAEAGVARNAEQLGAAVRYGELVLEGQQPSQEVTRAVPGPGVRIELLQGAARLLREWGRGEPAQGCNALAEYYARGQRDQAREVEPPAPREWNLEERADRVDILRIARSAFLEAGREKGAEYMGRLIEVGKMQLAGASDEEVVRAFEGMTIGNAIEYLVVASNLYREWGNIHEAEACAMLADYYRRREARGSAEGGQAAERERAEREGVAAESLAAAIQGRPRRIEILREARAVHAEAGHADAAELLLRLVRLGELEVAGAPPDEIARAAEGLSPEPIIELVAAAAELCRERGNEGRARRCEELARFYRERFNAERGQETEPPRSDEERELQQLMERIQFLEAELRTLMEQLKKSAGGVR